MSNRRADKVLRLSPAMALRCFYVVDGEPVGPVSAEELFRLGRAGTFPAETLVWIERTADWQPFASWAAGFESENPRVAEPSQPALSKTPVAEPSRPPSSEPDPPSTETTGRVESLSPRSNDRVSQNSWIRILVTAAAILVVGVLGVFALRKFSRTGSKNDSPAAASSETSAPTAIAPPKPMAPVQSAPGAVRVSHPTLNFSFDVPNGFVEFPSNNSALKLWKVYGRPAALGELSEVFGIQPLGTMLPRRHLEAKDLPKDKGAVISQVSWRGTMVDAFRFSETNNGRVYVSYNVQIPLKGEAIQLMFGAPAEREAELKSRVNALLASLDGPSDW